MKKLLLFLSFSLLLINANAQSVVFAQLQGTPVDITGWNLTGNAAVGNTNVGSGNSEVILTTNSGTYQSGGVFFSQPINIVQCDKWTAEFELRMFDGSGADGIAFCVLDVPPTGFVNGGGVGIPSASNGLKVVFDTYNNAGGANPGLQIRWGAGYNGGEANTAQPTLDNTSGQLSFIRSNDYNAVRVEYDAGQVDVYVNNTLYISGFYVINFTSYIGFTSSTGSANDVQSVRNVTIRANMALADAGADVHTCPNDPVQIGAANDTAYQYQWSPGTGLDNPNISNPTLNLSTPGTYTYAVGVNINGATCIRYDSVTVVVDAIPTSTFTVDAAHCIGDPVTITYTGTASPNATYNWNFAGGGIVSGSGAGPYQVSWPYADTYSVSLFVNNSGCGSSSYSQNVVIEENPVAYFQYEQTDNYGLTFTSLAEGNATTQWMFGGMGTSNQPVAQFNYPSPGTYPITMIVTNSCGSDTLETNIYVLQIATGLNEAGALKGISLYPNPAETNLVIQLDGYDDTFNYCITDISGKTIACQNKLQGPTATIDVSGIAQGLYFIAIETKAGRAVAKLVKN